MLTEAKGLPDGVAVTGVNGHEATQVQAVLDSIPVLPTPAKDNFAAGCCADKSYNAEAICRLLAHWSYCVHILSRREEADNCLTRGYRIRRWFVDRTHAWFNRFRRLLIRWKKKVTNYKTLLHLACDNEAV